MTLFLCMMRKSVNTIKGKTIKAHNFIVLKFGWSFFIFFDKFNSWLVVLVVHYNKMEIIMIKCFTVVPNKEC